MSYIIQFAILRYICIIYTDLKDALFITLRTHIGTCKSYEINMNGFMSSYLKIIAMFFVLFKNI